MANKIKEKKQKSKLLEVLTKEYRWENLILALLTMAGTIVSMLIIMNVLTIDENFPVLGKGNAGIIFAWALFGISMIGFLILLYPFISPSIPEFKKISWPGPRKFLSIATRVLIFIVVLTLILYAFDLLGTEILRRVNEWRNG